MNFSKIAVLLAIVLAMSGCTTRTSGGECIGIADDRAPGVKYKVSGWNLFLAILFAETIVVPVVVVVDNLMCPVEQ